MRKKLFAVIMSVMMMVTFMPAMAFAATGCTHNYKDCRVVVTGWSADYSKVNVSLKCYDCEKTLASASVDTVRTFDTTNGGIWACAYEENVPEYTGIESALENTLAYQKLFPNVPDVDDVLNDTGVQIDGDLGYYDHDDEEVGTLYYDFNNATVAFANGTDITELTADEYLYYQLNPEMLGNFNSGNGYAGNTNGACIKFTEPENIDSYKAAGRTKAQVGTVDLCSAFDPKAQNWIVSSGDSKKVEPKKGFLGYYFLNLDTYDELGENPDVRVDIELPEYTPYADSTTFDVPVKFQKYANIEPANAINLSTDKTQKIKITTNDLSLNYHIIKYKNDPDSEDNIEYCDVYSTEKEAKVAMGHQYYNNYYDVPYLGEDVGFEVATQNVSVEYGTIDDLGNVTYSATAPEVVNVKYESNGYYHDTNYHFVIKISKAGSETVYMPVVIKVVPADVEFGFKANQFYAGIGEELDKADLVGMELGYYLAGDFYKFDKKYTFANDKANLDKFFDEYVTIHNLDTSKKHSVRMGLEIANDKTEEELVEEFGDQFMANFDLYNRAAGEADLYVTDAANQIRISNKIKTFHVKNAAKLKSTKKFQLKAKANYGKVTFKKVTAKYAKIKISKTGKVTVKKGLKKGTYKVKFKAFAPCKTVTRTMVIKIKK